MPTLAADTVDGMAASKPISFASPHKTYVDPKKTVETASELMARVVAHATPPKASTPTGTNEPTRDFVLARVTLLPHTRRLLKATHARNSTLIQSGWRASRSG